MKVAIDIKCTDELLSVLSFAGEVILEEHPAPKVTTPYFIVAMIDHRQNKAYQILNKLASSYTISSVKDFFLNEIQKNEMTSARPNSNYRFHETFMAILKSADERERVTVDDGKGFVTTNDVLLSVLRTDQMVADVFKNAMGVGYKEFLAKVVEDSGQPVQSQDKTPLTQIFELPQAITSMPMQTVNGSQQPIPAQILAFPEERIMPKKNGGAIATYCEDLVDEARNGRIDELIGRNDELKEIYRVLGRRGKNNVLLLGEGGVGKTEIIKGLALKIAKGEVPESVKNKRLYMLDLTALFAGTEMRGMLEKRLKVLINELKASKNNILFVDDIHMLSSQGKADVDLISAINQSLSNNEIQVIGTTTYKNYRRTIESDTSFDRKFTKIDVMQNTKAETIDVINGIKSYYEKHHKVKYPDTTIEQCVNLAEKYVSDRQLPDSAIDILDEAGSSVRLEKTEPTMIVELEGIIAALEAEKVDAIADDDLETVNGLNNDIKDYKKKLAEVKYEYDRGLNNAEVGVDVVNDIVSKKTGIPSNKLSVSEKKALSEIDEKMKAVVIGQDEAIEKICKAVKRNRVGLGNPNKPVTFLELGKTGVGKTLVAKTLAKEVFGDEKYLVRFDMSEYADKTSVSKLIGTGAGYIGYDNGGLLTEALKKNKYCVLLCDEIEKADPEVYNVFLQIMDEGRVSDNTGKKIDCKNLVLIFTSNIGAREADENGRSIGLNIQDTEEKSKKIWEKELKGRFTPEFLNRIDDIIYFNSLTDDDLRKITRLELEKVTKRLEDLGHTMAYDDDIVNDILDRISGEKDFGARPIARTIQETIVNGITDALLETDYKQHRFVLSIKDDELVIE